MSFLSFYLTKMQLRNCLPFDFNPINYTSFIPNINTFDLLAFLHNYFIPHDSTDVSSEVASTGRWTEIFLGVEPVRVDHEVAVRQVTASYREDQAVGEAFSIVYVSGDIWKSAVLTFLEIWTCSFR